MSKVINIAAGLAVVPMLAMASPVFADSPGQLMGGSALYEVKNITKGGSYAATASANACEEVQYSIEVHNTEFGKLSNINLKATLPSVSAASNTSNLTASATNSAGSTIRVNGSVTVTSSTAQTITYEAGSTTLYDNNGKVVKTLADGITAGGLNIGDLNGSTGEFVNFKAKLNCETTPPVTPPVTPPTTPPNTPTTPTELPNTGAGNVVGVIAGVIVAGFVAGRLYLSRKLARQN